MRNRLAIALMMVTLAASAQTTEPQPAVAPAFTPVAAPPCVHKDKNALTFPGGREQFERFRSLLGDSSLQVRILHIGGSHVQAGHFSHRMRVNLGGGQTSRGYVFPFAGLKTKGPTNYIATCEGQWSGERCLQRELTLDLGVCGAALATTDTLAAVGLRLPPFSRLTALCTLADSVTATLTAGCDTIIGTRDSLGNLTFALYDIADTCRLALSGVGEGRPFSLRGFMAENDTPGVVYCEAGVNGASVPTWLRCSRFADDLSYCPPDLVIFGIGINDANVPPSAFDPEQYKDNYRQLIARIRSVNPDCALLFVTNNDCFLRVRGYKRTYNRNTPKVERAMEELAAEYGGAVWNLYRVMGGLRSSGRWVSAGLMQRDHIHFTQAGYELLGDLLTEALLYDND